MFTPLRQSGGRNHTPRRGPAVRWKPAVELLEDRQLLTAPFTVGGDPIVNPSDFRITVFASGLNYPHGLASLVDGSLLVGINNPKGGGTSFYNTTGQLVRFVDTNDDGVADGPGTVLFDGLPGQITSIQQAGNHLIAVSSQPGVEQISVLRQGATPADALTYVGGVRLQFPSGWMHTIYTSAVRPTPGSPGDYDLLFNIGSQFNGVVIGSDGKVVLDENGNPTYQPTTGTVSATGLFNATLMGDSIYLVTLRNADPNAGGGDPPVFSGPIRVASGLRNAASLAFHPITGDLYFAENGIDGNSFGNESWSTDELNRLRGRQIGGRVENFGYPYSYHRTVEKPGDPVTVVRPRLGRQPLVSFQPLPDPTTEKGVESEGASGFAISPRFFPPGLNRGVFVGFHGKFNTGGLANEENPVVFVDPRTGHYFHFISTREPNVGHIDNILSTADSLYLADLSTTGDLFGAGGPGNGAIYQIKAVASLPAASAPPRSSLIRRTSLSPPSQPRHFAQSQMLFPPGPWSSPTEAIDAGPATFTQSKTKNQRRSR